MREKRKEPVADKQAGSKDEAKARAKAIHIFKVKEKELKSQESLLLFLFVENYPKILTEPMIELIWDFMEFLKSNGYHIVNEKEVFCFPFLKLVRKGDLK